MNLSFCARVSLSLATSLALLSAPGFAQDATRPGAIRDKTLVAWVTVADLAQRGGGVLTLMEGEDFDSIVFGERVPGRWMAGSDFFRRTQAESEQSTNAVETAGPETLVQVAAVYRGQRVSLFRNGEPYASYSIDRPRRFGRDAAILIGLRYLGSMGEIGFFGGSVEEARVYDVALEREALVALKPNVASSPAPVGQWTFEHDSLRDEQGRFPPGELRGGARLSGGRLHLDGRQACFVSRPADTESQGMFYFPRLPATGVMWDTWLYYHQGTYHLYYLAHAGSAWDNISMATSTDGVHWRERGVILRKAEGVTWMGTGSTWRSPQAERAGTFQMNFSEWRGERQTIFFAESTNLVDWHRLGPEREFTQDARWYKPQGRWDCIYTLPRTGGGLWGYWTADPSAGPGVGFGQSTDGVRWEALEPPRFLDGAPHGEAGAVERIGDRYYLMLGAGGMRTLVGERPEGPFRPATVNPVLLHGGPTYFSRFFPTNPDGLLVNHHAIAKNGRVYFGLLKRAVVDAAGTLRLGWWSGNERLKAQSVAVRLAAETGAESRLRFLETRLPADDGFVLEGRMELPADGSEPSTGLLIETEQEEPGIGLLIGRGGVGRFGPVQADGTLVKAEVTIDRGLPGAREVRFRLVLKRWLLELYVDDILLECFSLPARATGRIGFLGRTAPTELSAWR